MLQPSVIGNRIYEQWDVTQLNWKNKIFNSKHTRLKVIPTPEISLFNEKAWETCE
jgi:hypothetical protein